LGDGGGVKPLQLLCGLVLALPGQAEPSQTLRLQLEPDQRAILAGGRREVVLKIDLEAAECRNIQRLPLNLAVVLDRSGSMTGAKIEKARQAAMGLIDQLSPRDTVALVAYESEVDVLYPSQALENRESLKNRIARIEPGGSTALYAGVETGAEQLQKFLQRDRLNRVILLSDGIANVGPSSTAELKELGRRLARRGISVTTIGVGDDYNEDLMAGLAEASDANYYYVQDAEKLPDIFAKELGALFAITARNVRIEISCPEGVEPIEFIGRTEKFSDRKAVIAFGPFASGQRRQIFLRCQVDAGQATAQRDVATVNVAYLDEINGARPAETRQTALVNLTTNATEAAASVNAAVAAERELQLNAVAKEQALTEADAGRFKQAAASLKSYAEKLEAAAPAAPAALRDRLQTEAEEQRKRASEIEATGMTKAMRKTLQNESYQRKNAKE
jgi:Ca-activated chloride channel family protein